MKNVWIKLGMVLVLTARVMNAHAEVRSVKLEHCDERSGATVANLLSGAKNQKSVMNDRVTLFQYDRGEPAAQAVGIAVAFEAQDEANADVQDRRCVAIPGLAKADLSKAKVMSRMLPGTRFLVSVPVQVYDADRDEVVKADLLIKGVRASGRHGSAELSVIAELNQ